MSDWTARPQMAGMEQKGADLTEEALAEVDEPPDIFKSNYYWSPPHPTAAHMLPLPNPGRRESLLTRQLHSETEHTDNDEPMSPARALSTQSTWSSISMPSTAELTSDDGHSVPSTTGSPPIPPPRTPSAISKPLDRPLTIVAQNDLPPPRINPSTGEDTVEANLGRKRCISFACRNKQESKPAQAPLPCAPQLARDAPHSPPKRKCMLKFVCPSRAEENKSVIKSPTKRPVSPPPPGRRSPVLTRHRGSDSTVTNSSPRMPRRVPDIETIQQDKILQTIPRNSRRYSDVSNEDSGDDQPQFHEFAMSEDEPEPWTQMSTCHRTRLTVDDTLKKENVIRRTCEEVEEEALEEEEEAEKEDLDDELAAVAGMEGDDVADDGDDTDEGFHSDDEGGFASSDSDGDSDSDFEWWKPSGLSTAATSVDQLDRLAIVNGHRPVLSTSVGSASSSPTSPRSSKIMLRKQSSKPAPTPAMAINKAVGDDLPDSTDFVCGTLDEDRSLEEEFINRRKQQQAAKRPLRPQDIDPTFPTSDPEMDESDDDDVDKAVHSGDEDEMMHGALDELDGGGTIRRRSPIPRARTRSNIARSPAPATVRHHSPAPIKQRAMAHSPPPTKRKTNIRSPPPPRKLFGHSPTRMKSPAPVKRMTSPPNSPTDRSGLFATPTHGLGGRPQLTQTSSLPRNGVTNAAKLATIFSDDDETNSTTNMDTPKRGAIDIVKGLEKKRAWRKKKLAQKMSAKAASKCEKPCKIKPGLGAERMREVGLQLQNYRGKAEHILSL